MKSLVPSGPIYTTLPCTGCGTPTLFLSSVSTCPGCGSVLEIVDSSVRGKLVKLLRNGKRRR